MRSPLEQLERSHRRLEEACDALVAAARDRDIEVASNVCAFFTRQGHRHEADEDGSLFPRLAEAAGASDELHRAIARLSAEHGEHALLTARLEDAVSGRYAGDLWSELETIAALLTEAYRAHIEEEERLVFPAARQLLGPDMLDAMSREMDARRGR